MLFGELATAEANPARWTENLRLFLALQGEASRRADGHDTKFLYVDLDAAPTLTPVDCPHKIAIQRFKDGKLRCPDVHKENKAMGSICLARSDHIQVDFDITNKRKSLEIPCPASTHGTCKSTEHTWKCFNSEIEYGFDEHFYCACGKGRYDTYFFRCSDEDHDTFEAFKDPALLGGYLG